MQSFSRLGWPTVVPWVKISIRWSLKAMEQEAMLVSGKEKNVRS